MERQELEAKIIELVSIAYGKDVASLSVDTVISELGGASVQMVGLCSEIENELDAFVQLADAAACGTIADLIDLVEEEL